MALRIRTPSLGSVAVSPGDQYLLESSSTDGYLLEDGSGVLLLEAPTAYAQSVNAAASSATSVVKSVGKSVAATGNGAVTMTRSVGKRVAATGTGAVTMTRSIG